MKKKVILTVFLSFLCVRGGEIVFAQDLQVLDKRFAVGARASYLEVDEDDISLGEIQSEGTVFFEGNLTYFPIHWFSLELLGGYTEPDLDLKNPLTDSIVEFGDLEEVPIMLTARFHWWTDIPLVGLYAGGGFGYFINDIDVSSTFRTLNPGVAVDVDDSFGFIVAAGIEYFLTKHLAINADAKYIWNEADFDVTGPGSTVSSFDLDLDTFVVGGGLKYYF